MPFFTPSAYVGIGVETVRGTPAASLVWFPTEAPEWTPNVTWLEDKSLRGSAPDIYAEQAGVRHDQLALKGMVFLDTFPNLIRAALGSADTVTTAPASTTLSASAAAGAASVTLSASVAAGSWIVVTPSGAGPQGFLVTAASGSTAAVTPHVAASLPSGASVTGLTGHQLALSNTASVGSQPPSYTVAYYTAGEAGVSDARQFTACQLDSLSLSFASAAALSFEASFLCNPATVATVSAPSFSTEWFVPAWACAVQINGTTSDVILEGSIDIKRSTEVIDTLGQQSPYRLWAGTSGVTGKIKTVLETGDTTITDGTTRVVETFNLFFTEPTTQHALDIQMSQVQLRNPKLDVSKNYMAVDADFLAEGNTTDAIGGGFSNVLAKVGNAQTGAY